MWQASGGWFCSGNGHLEAGGGSCDEAGVYPSYLREPSGRWKAFAPAASSPLHKTLCPLSSSESQSPDEYSEMLGKMKMYF